jgi:hypothetical protein
MNVREINPGTKGTVVHYVATAVSFTLATVFIIAFQRRHETTLWKRLAWPHMLFSRQLSRQNLKRQVQDPHA